jgi:hypothetical protein
LKIIQPKPVSQPQKSVQHGIAEKVAKKVVDEIKDVRDHATLDVIDTLGKSYETTKTIARIIAGIGWALIGLALFISGITFLVAVGSKSGGFLVGLVAAIVMAVFPVSFGLILVMSGQITRAIVDVADTNQKILDILRTSHKIS